MTVLTTIDRNEYTQQAPGTQDTFAYEFKIWTKTDLKVYVEDVLQTVDVHYTVTPIEENMPAESGGNVVFGGSYIPAEGEEIVIQRDVPYKQEWDAGEAGAQLAETMEVAVDKLEMQIQQVKNGLDGVITQQFTPPLPITGGGTGGITAAEARTNLSVPSTDHSADHENSGSDEISVAGLSGELADNQPTTWSKVTNRPHYDCREYASLNAAVTAIGATECDLVVANNQTLTANLTIPSTMRLRVLKGGLIIKASTYTVTINGTFKAGNYQAFSGFSSGDVTFAAGTIDNLNPLWFSSTLGQKYYNIADFPGSDWGAKVQAAYNYALARRNAGDGILEGMVLLCPPNPEGGLWTATTSVDLSDQGYVCLIGLGNPQITAGDDMSYFVKFGDTAKANRVLISGLDFCPGDYSVTEALLIGGGTRNVVRDISFTMQLSETGDFTNGILIQRDLDPTGAGVSYSLFENIHDSGGTPCTNAMIKVLGMITSEIRNMRVGNATGHGIELDSSGGNIEYNRIGFITPESGAATTTSLIRAHSNDSTYVISQNHFHDLVGLGTVDYGVNFVRTDGNTTENRLDFICEGVGFTTAAFNNQEASTGYARNVFNGMGYNNGDPNSTGNWNGYGSEGILVVDTATGNVYLWAASAWRSL